MKVNSDRDGQMGFLIMEYLEILINSMKEILILSTDREKTSVTTRCGRNVVKPVVLGLK